MANGHTNGLLTAVEMCRSSEDRDMSEISRKAVHEAAHAILAYRLRWKVQKVSCHYDPARTSIGGESVISQPDGALWREQHGIVIPALEASRYVIARAGRLAEQRRGFTASPIALSDDEETASGAIARLADHTGHPRDDLRRRLDPLVEAVVDESAPAIDRLAG